MTTRVNNLLCAFFLLVFSVVMLRQLDGVPVEGVLFPRSVLYLLMACSILMALRGLWQGGEKVSFFGDVPPARWCVVAVLFTLQTLAAMYLSFIAGMALGMLLTLVYLTPVKNIRSICGDALFVTCFIIFFELFFTHIMHIYFPENLF